MCEAEINRNCSVTQLAVAYCLGHPGIDWIFMESLVLLFKNFQAEMICGDCNYWVDDPVQKP